MTEAQSYEQIMKILWWIIGALVLLLTGFVGAWANALSRSLDEIKNKQDHTHTTLMNRIDDLQDRGGETEKTVAVHGQKITNIEREVFKKN